MRKSLLIVVAALLPTTMSAQSALRQLESLAGRSINDVYVPKASDPVRVDYEEEEEQPPHSTRLKDYTPAQETTETQPEEQRKKTALQEMKEREQQIREEVAREQRMVDERYKKHWKAEEEDERRRASLYYSFLDNAPSVSSTPVFSSINERNVVFDHPMSMLELINFGNFKLDTKDSLYKADMLRAAYGDYPNAYFLGRRLGNGRVEWRMFTRSYNGFDDRYEYLDMALYYPFKQEDIMDVMPAAEGRLVLLKMRDGRWIVLNPKGETLCKGKDVKFPCMANEGVFVECDGKLYCSNAPRSSSPILSGEKFEYHQRSVVVTKKREGNTYYTLSTYGGKNYNYKEHAWMRNSQNATYSYIGAFSNDGDYYVIQPQGKKYYYIVSYLGGVNGGLYRGKKKYKTLEAAHAAWPKEQAHMAEMWRYKPYMSAHNQ